MSSKQTKSSKWNEMRSLRRKLERARCDALGPSSIFDQAMAIETDESDPVELVQAAKEAIRVATAVRDAALAVIDAGGVGDVDRALAAVGPALLEASNASEAGRPLDGLAALRKAGENLIRMSGGR